MLGLEGGGYGKEGSTWRRRGGGGIKDGVNKGEKHYGYYGYCGYWSG